MHQVEEQPEGKPLGLGGVCRDPLLQDVAEPERYRRCHADYEDHGYRLANASDVSGDEPLIAKRPCLLIVTSWLTSRSPLTDSSP